MSGPADKPAKTAVVIGGGLVGVSTALALRREGLEVRVLERALPGAEASTAAAGILGAEIENETTGPLYALCRASQLAYPDWVREIERVSDVPTSLLDGGSLELADDEAALLALGSKRRAQLESGRARLLSGDELRRFEPEISPNVAGGVLFPDDQRITPRALFRATHIAAHRAGVAFTSGARVSRVIVESVSGEPVALGALLDDGNRIQADVTVVAAGSWTSLVAGLPLAPASVVPARGQIVELQTSLPKLGRVVFGSGVYLVPRSDGHLLVGSTLEFVGYQKGVTAAGVEKLLAGALRTVPSLGDAEFVDSWSNFRPYTPDHLPLLGDAGVRGLVVASGHHRNGILLSPITALLAADLALGRPPRVDLTAFDPRRRSVGSSHEAN